ncbi:MAG: hypothetical protein KDB07_12170 [Planctomycetes bacterium]|nr:hypothetical protein [Planctomycetota bacterium]
MNEESKMVDILTDIRAFLHGREVRQTLSTTIELCGVKNSLAIFAALFGTIRDFAQGLQSQLSIEHVEGVAWQECLRMALTKSTCLSLLFREEGQEFKVLPDASPQELKEAAALLLKWAKFDALV